MAFRPSEYLRPESIEEAVAIMERYGDESVLIAGGITVNELGKRGFLTGIGKIVDIERLGLNWIHDDRAGIRIGAATTYAEIQRHEAFKTPALSSIHEAVANIHPDQVKNVGTIGGAVCSGFSFLDIVPALLVHDARLTIVGPRGEREVRLDTFAFSTLDERLGRGEMLREISLSSPAAGTGSAFTKYAQTSLDLSILNCSASLSVDEGGIVRAARVSAAGKGVDLTSSEECVQALVGEPLSDKSVERAGEALAGALPDVSDTRYSSEFRRYTMKRLLSQTLNKAYRRATAS